MLPAESLGCDELQRPSRNTPDFNQPPRRPSCRISLCHTARKHVDALTATKMQPLSGLILFFLFLDGFFEGPAKGPEFTADTIGQFLFPFDAARTSAISSPCFVCNAISGAAFAVEIIT